LAAALPGLHTVNWPGRDQAGVSVPSGVYVLTVSAGSSQAHQKVVLCR
ncbi:MAG: hypothetical protein H5U38_02585, partial [Calditrichaeota bacterium]|nr:hypothetical protein [Calditrichota bacterium]